MPPSKGPSSLLEAQNRVLIKTAGERAAQIETLERELQRLQERATQADRLECEVHGLQAQADKLERELQSLKDELQRLRETAAESRKLERELQTRLEGQMDEIERVTLERDVYSKRALALEDHNRQLTDTATKYALWGQELERELARIDPDGAPAARRFEAQHQS